MKNGDKKKYQFSEAMAMAIGLEEAIMFNNIYFWVTKNTEKESFDHYHDGKYWTYNSVRGFTKQFPYWTPSMIKRILRNLEKEGYIETGVYNDYGPDRTKWYTVTQKSIDLMARSENRFGETRQQSGENTPTYTR